MKLSTRLLALTAVGAAAVAPLVLTAAPVSATPPSAYVALGDSHASGVAAGPYDPASGECLRSLTSYAPKFASEFRLRLTNATCSGATTEKIVEQAKQLTAKTKVVTISIGGNDAGFSSAVGACRTGTDQQCDGAVATGLAFIQKQLPAKLDATYRLIAQKAPKARVAVVGYPRLFETGETCANDQIAQPRRVKLNGAADEIAKVIAARVKVAGPKFAFLDSRSKFAGHGVCAADSWVKPLDPQHQVESYHPTQVGHDKAYLPLVKAWYKKR